MSRQHGVAYRVRQMSYHGAQFRMARAATRMSVREICAAAHMSARTVALIESGDEIEYGVRQSGKFEEETIAKLVEFYRRHGVTFVPASASRRGPGVHVHQR